MSGSLRSAFPLFSFSRKTEYSPFGLLVLARKNGAFALAVFDFAQNGAFALCAFHVIAQNGAFAFGVLSILQPSCRAGFFFVLRLSAR